MSSSTKFRAWNGKEYLYIDFKEPETLELARDADIITHEQYTGLKDKNGVEIYEGDIVKQGGHKDAEVFFRDGSFCTYIDVGMWLELSQNSFNDSFEVIGNIHENPELVQ